MSAERYESTASTLHPLKVEQLIYPDGRQRQIEIATSEVGVAGVAAQWGFQHSEADWNRYLLAQNDPEATAAAKVRGFPHVFQSMALPSQRLEREVDTAAKISLELETARAVIMKLLEQNGIRPNQIDFLTLGTGSPLSAQYALDLAHEVGLKHISTNMTYEVNEACNSGGQALWRAATLPEFQGLTGINFGIEGWTRLLDGNKPFLAQADPLSLKTFADGMAATIIQPGVTHRPVTHFPLTVNYGKQTIVLNSYPWVIPDEDHALDGNVPYLQYMTQGGPWFEQVDRKEMIRLNQPVGRSQIEMHGEATARGFLGPLVPHIEAVWKQFQQENPGARLAHFVIHHASPGVNGIAERKVQRMGIAETVPFVLEGGNSSSSTMLRAYVRLMREFKPEDYVMIVSFGAGMSFTVFIMQMGSFDRSLLHNH
ncbi:MAG: hypothetical protein WC775_03000 [Patescibacteria group bacterium]|jgi:3-oxoacyl-[acyl-carrier-protein] synthase III